MTIADEMDPLDVVELSARANELRIRDFTEILSKIEGLDDKKRQLWIEIYQNCISDRQNAYALFMKLVDMCKDKSIEWATHGRTIVQMQERMSRANDQMLKLADLVQKAERAAKEINPEDIYDALGG